MFDPWGALDLMPGWRVEWRDMARAGLVYYAGRAIVLSSRLTRCAERCVLAHEIVHAERGPCPRWMRSREERTVSDAAARRLIDLDDLGEALAWSLHPVVVADELDVDVSTLRARLDGLTSGERAYLRGRTAHHS